MFENYIKTAFRSLRRERGSSLINIAGLSLGITCSLILFLMVRHLSSFDNYHEKGDRIFRVVTESDGNGEKFHTPGVPTALPDAFRNDFPEAEQVTFLSYRSGSMVSVPQPNGEMKKYQEESGVVFAEPNFFKIFDRRILEGSADKGLDEPNEAIISAKLASKYFGEGNAIGSIVRFDTIEYKITALMEDYPSNTDFPFDLMLSYTTIEKEREARGWGGIWSDEQCYILLEDEGSKTKIESRMPAFVKKYIGDDNYDNQNFLLQPLADLHFNDDYETYTYSSAPKEMLIALGIIAVFLIVTACINFINLSTAEAVKRSKEVGVRKTLGSSRKQLIMQFLGETTFVTLVSMLLSLGLTQMMLGFVNPFLELELSLDLANDALLWAFIVGVTAVVALLSGLYPAFVMSGFRPSQALKNRINARSSSGFNLRRSLVVLQFVISQFFIIGTIVIIGQMDYFSKKNLGFKKDAVIVFPVPENEQPQFSDGTSKMRTLRDEVSRMAGVESASLSSTPPSSGNVQGTGFYFEGEDRSQRRDNQVKQIDGNYLELYDIKLIAGKNIEDFDTARGFLVNEELTKVAGFQSPQDIIGKKIHMWGTVLPVVGVVQNFHTVSLHSRIEPTVLMNRITGYRTLSVKANPAQLESVIADVKQSWEETYPDHIFDYRFLDDQIREFYDGERRMSILLSVFTSMAIFIGCLGLFGLATFMANQKTKEIGVRKALGASVESIVFLFTKEFLKLILFGFLIASPLAWFVMNEYLNNFQYRIELGVGIFVIGFAITMVIAIFTVGYKSFRAAIVNPISSLRYE